MVLKHDLIFSCSAGRMIKAWSVSNKRLKHELIHCGSVYDIVLGREGTTLEDRMLSISNGTCCRVFNAETGAIEKKITFYDICWSIAVDEEQTMIVIGHGQNQGSARQQNFGCRYRCLSFGPTTTCRCRDFVLS